MWYNTIGTHEEPYVEDYLCYAMFRGGIKWDKPDLGLVGFAGSTKNNIFMKWSSWTYCVVKDKNDPDPIRRYKLPYWPIYKRDYCGIWAAFSADGFDRDGFQYSLKIEWIWDENALSEEELSDDLDQATIWRVLDVDHANRFLEDLTPNIGKRAELHLYLADDEKLYETFLLLLAPYNSDRAARSLAKSTPRWSMVEARNVISQRKDLYAPLWKFHLMQSQSDPASRQLRDWASYAANRLEDRGVDGAHDEGRWPNPLQRCFLTVDSAQR